MFAPEFLRYLAHSTARKIDTYRLRSHGSHDVPVLPKIAESHSKGLCERFAIDSLKQGHQASRAGIESRGPMTTCSVLRRDPRPFQNRATLTVLHSEI